MPRAEYGLLHLLMKKIQAEPSFELQIIATGMHLSPEFGLTYKEIEKNGFVIDKKVEMLLSSDTENAITKSIGLATIGFADALQDLKPDLLIVLGDRYEILAAAITALIYKIPIAHIHGGETTEGAFDEAIRHSITKMSHIHFTATEEYRKRVIQLGENPERVFTVGGLGVDSIKNTKLLNKKELEESLSFRFGIKNLLITFHPVTLDSQSSEEQMKEVLDALQELEDTNIIFTLPNSDTGSRVIIRMIQDFVQKNKRSIAFSSLGQIRYFSTLQFVDGVVGNSSSGLLEVPSFKKGTINIGDRQKGRIKAISVIDCKPLKSHILESIRFLYSDEFRSILRTVKNPYGDGNSVDSIMKILKGFSFDGIIQKKFFDIEYKL